MTFTSGQRKMWLAAGIGAVLAAFVGWFLREFTIGRGLVNHSYDLLLVARGEVAAREAVIVYLDDVSYSALKQPLNAPWDRSLHARLIDRLTRAGARAIVFDVVFTDPMPNRPDADQEMAQAMKSSGQVVLGIEVALMGKGTKQAVPLFELLETNAAAIGSVEVLPDPDLVVRRLHAFDDDLGLPSLSGATAELLGFRPAQIDVPRRGGAWMNYYGPPQFLRSISYHEALDGARVNDDEFRDKVVFVGARLLTKFAGERKDEYPHPFSYWLSKKNRDRDALFTAGVEIQATACLNLLRGEWLVRTSPGLERSALLALGLLFGFGLVCLRRPVLVTVVALGGMVLVAAFFYLLFRGKLVWFPLLIVEVQIVVALAWSILFNSVQNYVEKQLYEQTLSLYLSPKLVKKFANNPHLLKPGAEEQPLTIFFSDIADFTAISQRLNSAELASLMNDYFHTAVADCIHKTDGTVVKYIGDAIFAFWNAPEAQADHPMRACEAALRFGERNIQSVNGQPLRTRIGIHTGLARVGNFGSIERVDYTALGESINLASRLEGLNKYLGTDCLISEATNEGIGERLVTRAIGQFQLKGFEKPVEAFEIVGRASQAEATRAWREAFAQALRNYRDQNLELAAVGFREVLELRPDDGPSKFYLERIDEMALQPLRDDWTGFTQLKEK